MKKHFSHYLLILMLAIAPMQSVLAGLAALEHVSVCETGAMNGDEHAGMDHHGSHGDVDKADTRNGTQCSCCADCLAMCVSAAQVSYPAGAAEFNTSAASTAADFNYQLANSSQHPFTDIRPPIVLL